MYPSKIRLLLISSVAVGLITNSWFGVTQARINVEQPLIDIELTSNRNEAAEVNDNQLLRIYPTFRLIGPPHSVKGNRTSNSSWLGSSRTTFVDKDGCTTRIADVQYSRINGRPYQIRFTDYSKKGTITSQACATITTNRRWFSTIQTVDIVFNDNRKEHIIINRNPLTNSIRRITVVRPWGKTTILKPNQFIEHRYLEYEKQLNLVTTAL
jgi:hypothetical protein